LVPALVPIGTRLEFHRVCHPSGGNAIRGRFNGYGITTTRFVSQCERVGCLGFKFFATGQVISVVSMVGGTDGTRIKYHPGGHIAGTKPDKSSLERSRRTGESGKQAFRRFDAQPGFWAARWSFTAIRKAIVLGCTGRGIRETNPSWRPGGVVPGVWADPFLDG